MKSNINPYILKKPSFFIDKFFQDYYDIKWQIPDDSIRVITYSFPALEVKTASVTGEDVRKDLVRIFSDSEKVLINNSIKTWDDAIDKIQFKLVDDDIDADVTFGFTFVDGEGGSESKWGATIRAGFDINASNNIVNAFIEFESDDITSSNFLTQVSLNVIGNILGMGDIRPSDSIDSIMETPNSLVSSGEVVLGDFDVAMIKSLYGESSFLSKNIDSSKPILLPFDNSENIAYMEVTNGDAIGIVKIELLPDFAPNHINQFKSLINDDFYDGLLFHRVVDNFVAQTGDPKGDGTGGSSLPNIDAEFSFVSYEKGTVGMARGSNVDSANSQFFITLVDYPSLENEYTAIGKVISGMEFIDSLQKGEPPASPDSIVSLNILEFKQAGTFNYSNNDDVIIATSTHSTYRGFDGDDTYFISHLLKENEKISIIDSDGYNTIQIPSNTYIDDAIFTNDAIQLTFQNGREVTINGADLFNYNLSGNVSTNEDGSDLSFSDFASIFGVENVLSSTDIQEASIIDMYII